MSPVAWFLIGFSAYYLLVIVLILTVPQDKRDRWPGGEIR